MTYDFAIVGGGIIGLATAMALGERYTGASIVLLEKEDTCAKHQTGHNSGVIHAGIYYKPGSDKARFSVAGNRAMKSFCDAHGIPWEPCGKVIVATEPSELPQLELLFERGRQNGLDVSKLSPDALREREPHASGIAALYVPETGITNYRAVADAYLAAVTRRGSTLMLDCKVTAIRDDAQEKIIETTRGDVHTRYLINCAGLYSDRVARRDRTAVDAQIVPFRGEYFELAPDKRYLCKNLIYPVPDPNFPFLGVHVTRMIDGSVHLGPNAVLAFHREGYHLNDVSFVDLADTLFYPGFWRLARAHFKNGLGEMWRSLSKKAFTRALQRLVPEITVDDLRPSEAGVRAQALGANGKLVDDFLIVEGKNSLHVCNAPSPAATASLMIGRVIAERARYGGHSMPPM